jgi:O-antigen ligase
MPFRILVALGVEIAAAGACLVKPYYGFLFYLFFIILRPQDDRPNVQELHYPMVLLLAALAGSIPRMAIEKDFSFRGAVQKLLLILLFFLWMVVSAVVTGYTPASANRIDEFIVVVIVCVLMIYWGSSDHKIWGLMGAFILAGLQISRDALSRTTLMIEQIGGQEFHRVNMNRLNGNFGSPNYIALLMSALILVCLTFLYTRYSKWLKLAALGSIGLFVTVFLKANSRGATLGLAASLIMFFLFQKRKGVSLVILSVLFVGILSFAPQSYFDRLKTIGSYEQDTSATARLQLWNIGMRLIKDNPIFGVGPDNFLDYAFNGPHDCYIQAAAEMGLPSAFLYCAILVSAYISSFQGLRLSKKLPDGENLHALCVALICIITHMTVQGLTTGFAHREFVYFFVTIAHCTYLVASKRAAALAPTPAPAPFGGFRRTGLATATQ